MIITPIPSRYVDEVWPTAEEWFKKATRYSKDLFSTADIKAGIDEGGTALWMIYDDQSGEPIPVASFTTRITDYPNGRGLVVDWVGGSGLKGWLDEFSNLLDRYGRDTGCTHIEAFGRDGWERVIKKFGYERVATYRKELK